MELLILVGAVVAVLGAMMITLALSPSGSKAAPQPSIDSATTEAPAAEAQPQKTGIQMAQAQTSEVTPSAQPAPVSEEPAAPVSLVERHDEVVIPTHPLQLEATEIISAQIERLQTEYIRISEDRTRLAQELLTSWLIDKFEESPNRLKSDTKREAQDLRQQLVKVSAEFERVEFRLSSLQNLQFRLDDPRVTQQIDDLVYAVKQLAREH